jgi:hypothetical protein
MPLNTRLQYGPDRRTGSAEAQVFRVSNIRANLSADAAECDDKYSLITIAKLHEVASRLWLTDALARIAGHRTHGTASSCRAIGSAPNLRPHASPDRHAPGGRAECGAVRAGLRTQRPWRDAVPVLTAFLHELRGNAGEPH